MIITKKFTKPDHVHIKRNVKKLTALFTTIAVIIGNKHKF
jgi:hypothetical protein